MFREMRRSRQELSAYDSLAVLITSTHGVLACLGDEDYPYAVPLSYVYFNKTIYFHSAKKGHKIDAIRRNPNVSFAIVGKDDIVSERFTTFYRSVIVFGKARITRGEERKNAFKAFVEKYSGDQPEEVKVEKLAKDTKAYIVAIDIEQISGKESKHLLNKKKS